MEKKTQTNNLQKSKVNAFLLGQAFSIFGTMLVQYAIIFHLTLVYMSGVISMLIAVCAILPQVIISVFSGAIADRYNRKILIIMSDTLTGLSTLILAIIFLCGYRELWILFLVVVIRSIGSGIQSPAVTAFIPQITPQEKLMKVNSINGSLQSLSMLISPIFAAAVLAVLTIEFIFFIDVITAVLAIFIMITIKAPKQNFDISKAGYFDDIKNGIKYVFSEKPLRVFILCWTVFLFLLTPIIILPSIHIARAFGSDWWRLATNEVLFALGALISGILLSTWGGFKSRLKTMVFGCFIYSVFTIFLGFGEYTITLIFGKSIFDSNFYFVLFVVFMFFLGVAMSFVNVPIMTLIMQYVKPELHGRVFSIVQIISASSIPLGSLLCGPIADAINIELMFLAVGILMFILSIYITKNNSIKKFEAQSVANSTLDNISNTAQTQSECTSIC